MNNCSVSNRMMRLNLPLSHLVPLRSKIIKCYWNSSADIHFIQSWIKGTSVTRARTHNIKITIFIGHVFMIRWLWEILWETKCENKQKQIHYPFCFYAIAPLWRTALLSTVVKTAPIQLFNFYTSALCPLAHMSYCRLLYKCLHQAYPALCCLCLWGSS